MSRRKYLYRVQAMFVFRSVIDGGRVESPRTWHYQSKASAEERYLKCRDGWSETHVIDGQARTWTHPAAESVTFERSEPITWPQASTAELPQASALSRRRRFRVVAGGAA